MGVDGWMAVCLSGEAQMVLMTLALTRRRRGGPWRWAVRQLLQSFVPPAEVFWGWIGGREDRETVEPVRLRTARSRQSMEKGQDSDSDTAEQR